MPTTLSRTKLLLLRCIPAVLFLVFWEVAVRGNDRLAFFFGSPGKIAAYFVSRIADGSLVADFTTTLSEVVVGFLIGNIVGTALGLALWFSRLVFLVARPYIIALGSAPLVALAPLLVIWFGTGFTAKVLIAGFSTLFVALFQAYSGASEVDPEYLRLMQSFRATKWQTFRKVVAPAAIVWVMSAFRMNVGFAILGAFLGEFISSSEGLGHLIVVASGLFDISLVFCAVFLLIGMALGLNYLLSYAEKPLKHLIVKYF
jgi:NitT/TauT family transport system permease protein